MSFRHAHILSSVLAFSLISSIAAAQPTVTSVDRSVTIGLKGGLNASEVKIEDDSLPLKPILDPIGGFFVGTTLTRNVGIQLEALVGRKGAQDDDDPADGRFQFTYIDVPVTVGFGTSRGDGLGFHVFTGPQVSVLLKAEEVNFRLDSSRDVSDEVKPWDFGWTIGAGVRMQRISLDARYTQGLLDINSAGGSWVRNRTATVMLGVRLR
jgi:hypothetical protein